MSVSVDLQSILIHFDTYFAGLKILFAAMQVRVQFPPGAQKNSNLRVAFLWRLRPALLRITNEEEEQLIVRA